MARVGVQLDDHELEGWKEIGAALGVSERTAKRFGRGYAGRRPIPTYRNLRGFRAILRAHLASWYAETPEGVEAVPASGRLAA